MWIFFIIFILFTCKLNQQSLQNLVPICRKINLAIPDTTMRENYVHSLHHVSVTELEVDQGLFQSPVDPNDKCLCFVRIISDIEKNIDHPKAWRYIDMTDFLIDHDAQEQLASLRDAKVREKLASENVHR